MATALSLISSAFHSGPMGEPFVKGCIWSGVFIFLFILLGADFVLGVTKEVPAASEIRNKNLIFIFRKIF